MSKTCLSFLPLVCCLLLQGFARAESPLREVQWFSSDFPPLSIVSGPYKGQGAVDQWQAHVIEQLGDLRHQQIVANTARIKEEMLRRENACNPAYLKTPEREKYAVFSEPLMGLLPNGLITLSSRKNEFQPYLNSRGELRLADLLAAQKMQLAVASGRSFGVAIDPVLQNPAVTGQLVQFNASDLFSSGLLQLTRGKHVDAVIGYAMELSWNIRRLGLSDEQFSFIPVEGETAPIPVYIACARSAAGELIIARVNKLIRTGKLPEVAVRAYREWLPEDVGTYYERMRKPGVN